MTTVAPTLIGLDPHAFPPPRPRHATVRATGTSVSIEPCTAPCRVDVLGCTDCGTLACPSCGRGGENLVRAAAGAPRTFHDLTPRTFHDLTPIAVRLADVVVACRCGCRWQPYAYGPEY